MGDTIPQRKIQFVLQIICLLIGEQHFFFVFFEFRGDIPFGILQRLFANIVLGNLFPLGMGNFQVVPEYPVVPHLQVGNA